MLLQTLLRGLALLHLVILPLIAQEDITLPVRAERALERFLESAEDEDISPVIELIESYMRHPLCLQNASLEDIEALPFLSAFLVRDIHQLIRNDSLTGWRVLQRLPTMDRDSYELLRICATLQCKTDGTATSLEYRVRMQRENTPRKGFLDGRFAPTRERLLHRLDVGVFSQLRAGVIIERDPGERDMTDHLAGYVGLHDIGPIQRAVLGDYTVAAAQGLVFWQAFGISKGGDALAAVRRSGTRITPHLSATEGLFYRGVATQLASGGLSAILFASRNRLDASIDEQSGTAGSFGIDGLHRTESELRRRRSVEERLAGGRIEWRDDKLLRAGLSGWTASYSVPSDPRTPFGFRGDRAWTTGADVTAHAGGMTIFGEVAVCHTHHTAGLAGVQGQLSRYVGAALLYRRYDYRFVNIHGRAFGERGSENANEEGMYFGMRLRPMQTLAIDAWIDVFSFPNRTYLLHLPTSGGESMLSARWNIDKVFTLDCRFKYGAKDNTVAAEDEEGRNIRPLARRTSMGTRVELICEPSNRLRVRIRTEHVNVRYDAWKDDDDGVLLLLDLRFRPFANLSVSARAASMQSSGYDARIYEFENDVRGVMYNVALYGHGWRGYLLAEYTPNRWLRVGMKYGVTVRDGVRYMGDGADRIEGDAIGRVTAQIDLTL